MYDPDDEQLALETIVQLNLYRGAFSRVVLSDMKTMKKIATMREPQPFHDGALGVGDTVAQQYAEIAAEHNFVVEELRLPGGRP